MSLFKFHMGCYVQDAITGIKGPIVSRCDHISGCNTYGISRGLDKDGKVYDLFWVDEPRLELIVDKMRISLVREESAPPG
jgi:hypothetical protein